MSNGDIFGYATLGVVMSWFVFFVFGQVSEGKRWQRLCIERGFGQYNSQTGNWEWVEPAPTAGQE